MQFWLAGSITGNGDNTGERRTLTMCCSAGPVYVGGGASFTLSRQTVDVDTDGNGTADLVGGDAGDALSLTITAPAVVEAVGWRRSV